MNEYQEYLTCMKRKLTEEAELLRRSDRVDESDFVRIRLNICDIADTIYQVFSKRGAGFESEYADRLAQMRKGWEEKLHIAEEYGDAHAVVVERVKTDTMLEIEEKFRQMYGC